MYLNYLYIFTFLITLIFIVLLKKQTKIGLDIPDGTLKPHTNSISRLGGLAFGGTFLFALGYLHLSEQLTLSLHYTIILFSFFLLGLWDDLKSLSSLFRLIIQLILGFALFYMALHSLFWGVLGAFLAVYIINAINMFDGRDGLLASQVLIGLIAYLFINPQFYFKSIVILLVICLFAFLVFNKPQAKIFMGDAGSYLLGAFILVLFTIEQSTQPTPSLSILVCFAIPFFDAFQVVIRRLYQKRSPFSGDRNHIYDILVKHHIQNYKLLLLIGLVQIAIIFITRRFL